MENYLGKCQYCGNEQPILAESQETADEQVSNRCDCGRASTAQKKARLMERINYIAKGEYSPAFEQLTEPQIKMLRQGGQDVIDGKCQAVILVVEDSKIKIWADGEKFKVKRSGSREEAVEV